MHHPNNLEIACVTGSGMPDREHQPCGRSHPVVYSRRAVREDPGIDVRRPVAKSEGAYIAARRATRKADKCECKEHRQTDHVSGLLQFMWTYFVTGT